MNIQRIVLFSFLSIILFFSCSPQKTGFSFKGRTILFSAFENDVPKIFLFNIDSNEIIELERFNDITDSKFLLYNQGQSCLIDQQTASYYIEYDIMLDESSEIHRGDNPHFLLNFFKSSIRHDTLYFASDSKIISYSILDSKIVREFDTEGFVYEFAIRNEDKVVVTHLATDLESKTENLSNLILYDFNNSSNKIDLKSRGILSKWSNDGKYLLFTKSLIPYLLEYPSLVVDTLKGFNQDSIKVVGESFFADNNTIIFPGRLNKTSELKTDLYLYNIQNDKIIQKLELNLNVKEIKSTNY
jgi:dipeptidyl aminopeptidase/acylaminoacyl peptidase